jgi:hypothetical protein
MRIEIHSSDGLEAAYQGVLDSPALQRDGDYNVILRTQDGFGVVLLNRGEAMRIAKEIADHAEAVRS